MDYKTYLVRTGTSYNCSRLRPSYSNAKLYSLNRPITVDDKVADPDDGTTTTDYPFTPTYNIHTYLQRSGIQVNKSKLRPTYATNRLYSLFRDVTVDDKTENPDDGTTTTDYPFTPTYNIHTYLQRAGIQINKSKLRPSYALHKLYSLFREITVHDPPITNPYTAGTTLNAYPLDVDIDSNEPSYEPIIYVVNEGNYVRVGNDFVIV
jgi:hypothetical protein